MIKLYEIKFNNERKKLFPIINIENIYITTYNDHYKFIKKKKLKKNKKKYFDILSIPKFKKYKYKHKNIFVKT
jgi:hypothetical protein